jgi:hypothetical protein
MLAIPQRLKQRQAGRVGQAAQEFRAETQAEVLGLGCLASHISLWRYDSTRAGRTCLRGSILVVGEP